MSTIAPNETKSPPFLAIGHDDAGEGEAMTSSSSSSIPIYFHEDWRQGIGGGLWSTGLAMSKYLTTRHARESLERMASDKGEGMSVLELGSGNGLLSICLLALSNHLQRRPTTSTTTQMPCPLIRDLAITDTADHLPLIQKTLQANSHLLQGEYEEEMTRVHIFDHSWGTFLPSTSDHEGGTVESQSFSEQAQHGKLTFDLIVGSDVAYREDLYDILIASLLQYAHANTMIMLGCTMVDTKPLFFQKLHLAGFQYRKFADHLLERDFRGQMFGIFVVEKQQTY
jgi:Lysine methyltransferase